MSEIISDSAKFETSKLSLNLYEYCVSVIVKVSQTNNTKIPQKDTTK